MAYFNFSNQVNGLLDSIRNYSVSTVTPFTHRDGYTYLQLLEKMRALILEMIDYINNFGEMSVEKLAEVDGIVTRLGEEIDAQLADVINSYKEYSGKLEDTSGELDKIRAKNLSDLENIKNQTQELINEFSGKILTSGFTVSGGKVSAPLISGGHIDVYTVEGIEEELRKAVEKINQLRQTIREENRPPDLTPYLRKTDAQNLYESKHKKPVAVFIGSSNAVNDTGWTGRLASNMGFEHHNFAVSGGSFTGSGEGTFLAQTRNAINTLGGAKGSVTHFFVADLLNDIRAKNDVFARADEVFALIRSNFPNARIIVLPVVLNRDNLNKNLGTYRSVELRTGEVLRAGNPYRVEVIPGSQSWLWGEEDEARATDQVNGVHLTSAGYRVIRQWVEIYLNDGYTWRNYGWRELSDYSQPFIDRGNSDFAVSRYENYVTIQGTARIARSVGTDTVLANIPAWAHNAVSHTFFVPTSDRSANKAVYINPLGQLVSRDTLETGAILSFELTYRLW